MKHRLSGIFGAFFVATILGPLAAIFLGNIPDEAYAAFLLALLGIVFIGAGAAWMAFLERFLPGVDRLRVTRGLLTLGVSLPPMAAGTASLHLSWLAWAVVAVTATAASWSVFELLRAMQGPPKPAWLPHASLKERSRGKIRPPIVEGTIEGLPITIEYSNLWQGDRIEERTLPCVKTEPPIDVELGPVTLLGSLTARQKTGDAAFDGVVHARGPRTTLLALLRAPARAAVAEVVAAGGTLSQGALRGDERLSFALLARAGHALAMNGTNSAALRTSVTSDPAPDVRLACLEMLIVCDLGGPDSRAACRAAIRDADPRVQVLGASQVLLDGDPADREVAEEALANSPIGLGAVVSGLLEIAEGTTAEALVRVLGARGASDATAPLERFAARADGALKELAQAAIANVAERTAAGRGRLSLDDTSNADAGAVSVADEAGALSLPAPKRTPTAN